MGCLPRGTRGLLPPLQLCDYTKGVARMIPKLIPVQLCVIIPKELPDDTKINTYVNYEYQCKLCNCVITPKELPE